MRVRPFMMMVPAAEAAVGLCEGAAAQLARLQSSDHLRFRSVVAVELSPDGKKTAYSVQRNGPTG